MPEPEPASWPPLTSSLTTEGSTAPATCSTLPSAAGSSELLDDRACRRGRRRSTEDAVAGPSSVEGACRRRRPPTPAPPPTTRAAATTAGTRSPASASSAGVPQGRRCRRVGRSGRLEPGRHWVGGDAGASPPSGLPEGGGKSISSFMCSTLARAPVTPPETTLGQGEEARRPPCGAAHTSPDTMRRMDAPEPQYVDDRIAHWARETPDAEAITYGPRTFTWARVGRPGAAQRRWAPGPGHRPWRRRCVPRQEPPGLRGDLDGRSLARCGQRDRQLAAGRRRDRLRASTTAARRCSSSVRS